MKKILIDTNAYAAFKNGSEEAVEVIRLAETVGMSTVVLGELLAGFVCGEKEARNRQELDEFFNSPRVSLFMVDAETPEYYARVFRQLRKQGLPIPTNDLWIAATAMQHGCAIFTYDKHFFNIDNLIVCRSPSDLLP